MVHIEPRTIGISELYEQFKQGYLRVPRFQRSFVWSRKQVLALFDSLYKGYPIGSLLIWRTGERYASFERIGPMELPIDEPAPPSVVGYVLDGHQRIATLLSTLFLPEELVQEAPIEVRTFLVYFDLAGETFTYVHPSKREEQQLPLSVIYNNEGVGLQEWLDERRDKYFKDPPKREQWNLYRRRAFTLQTLLAQYRIPFIDVTKADLDEAVNIFSLLNSQGTKVKGLDVFNALSWKPGGFDFAKEAKSLIERFEAYSNFGTEPILRAVLARLGADIYADNWTEILASHDESLPAALEEVATGFERATSFLADAIGARSGTVVPYAFQLVLLTEFFCVRGDPDDTMKKALRDWFFATSFGTRYVAGRRSDLNLHLERARQLARGEISEILEERPTLEPLPINFHPKSARVRVFHLFLASMEPRAMPGGAKLDPETLLAHGMADAVQLAGSGMRLAGRFLCGRGRRSLRLHQLDFQDLLSDGDERRAILESHALTDEAMEAQARGDLEEFLTLREAELLRRERLFAQQFVDLPDEMEDRLIDPEIDVEDELPTELL